MTDTDDGYTISEVELRTNVDRRRIRAWVGAGLLEAPFFRASATRYDEAFVRRVLRIIKLRDEGLNYDGIHFRLHTEDAIAKAEAARRPAPPPAQTPVTAPEPPPAPSPALSPALPPAGEAWRRIVLVPGLELHVRSDAGDVLERLAQEIRQRYGLQSA